MTTMDSDLGVVRATSRPQAGAAALAAVLTWPIAMLLITGAWHFTIEAIWPELRNFFVPAVLAPLLLGYGAWTGYRALTSTGSLAAAVVSGVILGLLPLMLDIVGFGLILGRGVDAGVLAGVFGFSMVLFGTLLGSGVAAGQTASRRSDNG